MHERANDDAGGRAARLEDRGPTRGARMRTAAAAFVVLLTAAGAASLILPGCGKKSSGASEASSGGTYSAEAIARGKQLYGNSCIACHGENGQGVEHLGKDLVHSTFAKGLSDHDLVEFIEKGRDPSDPLNTTHVAMPPKGGDPSLTGAKLLDVVAYLRSLEKGG